jgi:hypothetical protein
VDLRYTSFTGCTILLFSASQKLLELRGEDIGEDLLYVSSHLNVLSLCSHDNEMAKKLYTILQIIYNDIREVVLSPAYSAMRELRLVVKNPAVMPRSYYDGFEDAAEASSTILDLTRRVMDVLRDGLSV